MNKYGPHIQQPGAGLDFIARWKPRLCVLMDAGGDVIRRARESSPDTFIIVRRHREGADWKNTSPQAWADEVWGMVGGCPPDAVYYFNEPLGHDAYQDFEEFDQKQAEYIRIMRDRGVEALAFGFATGNFNMGGPNVATCFPKSTEIAKYVHLHEYGWPSMFDPAMVDWHTLRFVHWYEWFCAAGRDDLIFFITECGLTQAVLPNRPDHGWRSHADGVDNASYMRDLKRYHGELCKYPWVFGATPFNWYGWWPTFEHTEEPEVVNFIINLSGEESEPEPEPEPEPEEEEMDIKVYDRDGQERDLDWVTAEYGVEFRRAEVEARQKVYRLVELREKTGNSSLITNVRDENDNPMPNVDVALYWPDAPDPPEPATEVYPHDWYRNFVHGLTNENGDVGPGMGPGAYHGRGEGGPHAVWVRDPDIPSDICEKLGMLAGTPHDHLDQKFKLTVGGKEEEKPETGVWYEVDRGWKATETTNRIDVEAQGDKDFYDTQIHLVVADDPAKPYWVAPEPISPVSLTRYEISTAYKPGNGETDRRFWFKIQDPHGYDLSDWIGPFEYETDSYGIWVVGVDFRSEEEEEEPPSGLAGLYDDIADHHEALAELYREIAEKLSTD